MGHSKPAVPYIDLLSGDLLMTYLSITYRGE